MFIFIIVLCTFLLLIFIFVYTHIDVSVYMGTKNKYYERIQYTAKTFTYRRSRSPTNEILQRQYIH
jgi:hypothetical protein